ncbi:50S ribosomal protein L15 [Legionella quinlivanii]|uniref:Large ribosomal subunit protein uL15 n=1 Tax=Legionella quinlivanii TaxID=45073 RepID=A0A0W0XZ03_9GAMM|nr:50S ribosomal protein L15 [Legionella quinlivanii]KTD49634.1 50S ribosomal protein L15 [Legionella quinlivanii]MCW8452002.1 50S ribosomal protein L15 [Legionella quinlivanii]SEG31315.1 LSU ribosomal protein L15P [Legionella quinlivanii DSM 21216]STY09801.1 50S ribosomal protein L15 [Legionella quinlivanii]
MKLNTLSPDPGSKRPKQRLGRGIGSGLGKTSGKGHKGQKARAGGYHKINFEGGQMPIQRRLPKMGFKSRIGKYNDQITLSELASIEEEIIDMDTLRRHRLINTAVKNVKVILSGEINVAVKLKGIPVTKGARAMIEQAGGSIED